MLVNALCDYFLKKLSSLAQLHNEHIAVFIVVHLVESGDAGMVQCHHDRHLCEQLFMLRFSEMTFLNFLGSSEEPSVFSLDFANTAKSTFTDLLDNCVVL